MTQSSPHASFEDLYAQHQSWLRDWLRRKTGCPYDAADLTHDTYMKVLLRNEDARDLREPRAYLVTVAHGLLVNLFRRRDIERAYLDCLAAREETSWPSPERRALALEALVRIDRLLDGLPPKARRAFLLLQLEGLKHGEIAERLQVSVSSVRQYLALAMRHCLASC
ncbi:sigma-70 family RNA polymerase sigma factor [Achromobacter xylosoxidans]|uniref:sigma-70 family RNA polymerase sigma factor n=1 Tax=Alcaligenes xylosoxydans xylosoxydans TaxID=85698 RepID=UPI0003D689CC|nr:sigma-70 family RNA polymerase sigma factor [Achromobacter xylosoxidans]AHC49914.1 putative sigma-70 factor, ECF subfamily [Achromobacter xylosoxidans NBRC 15126 = ATCC 27061]QKQ54127.1 sigma-70 family RNA polymerase sigma factor [Achromobacter xylosoxidans]QPR96729.1 sigma-70 family RNA polymerase sigma factor [Achromobacter xylosoxidans]UON40669.1 sigma-70 family RNA polymerase sigma factor [Achromobacter xylosoxidans]CKI16469.1 Probable RNA polymerase sigma factor fecI [Achromobacter xyl